MVLIMEGPKGFEDVQRST